MVGVAGPVTPVLVARTRSRKTGPVTITTWYLETTDPADLRPARVPDADVRFSREEIPSPLLSLFSHGGGGGDWDGDALGLSAEQWRAWVDHPGRETWVLHEGDTAAGYAELDGQPDGAVEIAYLGLVPGYLGRGMGGHMLTLALERAWDLAGRWPDRDPTRRVWLHTCSLDGEHALANYLARGMTVYEETTEPDR